MKLSRNGLEQIVRREGVILHAYQDTVGVWTIGTGHTSAAGPPTVEPGQTITKEENDRILLRDLAPIEKQVNDTVKVKITQNQYDAIVSIIFNVGPKFLKSTSMKKLNAGDYQGAAEAIMLWNIPPEILGRRATEKKQFLTPDRSVAGPGAAAGAVVVGGAVAMGAPEHLFAILTATAFLAGLFWLGLHFYKKGKLADAQLASK